MLINSAESLEFILSSCQFEAFRDKFLKENILIYSFQNLLKFIESSMRGHDLNVNRILTETQYDSSRLKLGWFAMNSYGVILTLLVTLHITRPICHRLQTH